MRSLRFMVLMLFGLLVFVGCSRAPQETAAPAAGGGGVIATLASEAAGKAAFVEFYSPT